MPVASWRKRSIRLLSGWRCARVRFFVFYRHIREGGPALRGLRPPPRRYFGREPRELTPAEMAFLVAIIPGPIKYQSSFAHGTPGPGLRSLIDELLAKLRSAAPIGAPAHRQPPPSPIHVPHRRPPRCPA